MRIAYKRSFAMTVIAIASIFLLVSCAPKVNRINRPSMIVKTMVLSKGIHEANRQVQIHGSDDSFSMNDEEICASMQISNFIGEHKFRWEWIRPDNQLYYSTGNHQLKAEKNKYMKSVTAFHKLGIKGKEAEKFPGNWKINLYMDDEPVASKMFALKKGKAVKDVIVPPEPVDNAIDRPKPEHTKTKLLKPTPNR
ncbi:MAG: hypothetical protein KJ737_17225 [Proteobacteria bacterium]|nr:hypothetical protein [Pseudomonadota bacterium]